MAGFDHRANYDALPIGTVLQSPLNLERITNGKFVAMDGRDLLRSQYPQIADYFPAGVFTSTARTLNASPVAATLATDGTNFLCPGAAGTSPLQASADGITWSTSATWGASTSPACIIVAGSRYIMAGSGGDLTVPYVSTTGQTAANQVAKTNWTATTVAGTSTLAQSLAYSSSLGRTVLIPNGAGTAIHTLEDGATAWVARTATSATKTSVVWTGQKFLVFTSLSTGLGRIQTSADGITWADEYLSFPAAHTASASDGRGTVVVLSAVSGANSFIVTSDHGATWRQVPIPAEAYINAAYGTAQLSPLFLRISYANGRFICSEHNAAIQNNTLMSADGLVWFPEPIARRGLPATTICGLTTYKSGVYLTVGTTTAAFSSTEDMSRFRIPNTSPALSDGSYISLDASNHMEYMKVRM